MTTTAIILLPVGTAGALLTLGYKIGYAGGHVEGYLLGLHESKDDY